jgi:hypothetical protein
MLTIETDRIIIYNNEEFKVCEGGDFAETELVTVYRSDDPLKNPLYALQA